MVPSWMVSTPSPIFSITVLLLTIFFYTHLFFKWEQFLFLGCSKCWCKQKWGCGGENLQQENKVGGDSRNHAKAQGCWRKLLPESAINCFHHDSKCCLASPSSSFHLFIIFYFPFGSYSSSLPPFSVILSTSFWILCSQMCVTQWSRRTWHCFHFLSPHCSLHQLKEPSPAFVFS